jgi:hypothetical protein
MAVIENGLDAFTERVVDKRITGYTFDEIAKEMGVPTVEVVKTWKSYVDNRMEMSSEEQFVLMLLRLENFLTKANERLTNAKGADDYELVLKRQFAVNWWINTKPGLCPWQLLPFPM